MPLGRRLARVNPIVRRALLTAAWTANLVLVAITIYGFFVSDVGYDWQIYVEAGRRVGSGQLYAWEGTYAWSYSPLMAYAFAVLAPIGYVGWSVLHVASLGFLSRLRDWRLALIAALSWPFWGDLYNGNTMVFVFVAAAAALEGSGVGTLAYLVLCLLMPRPLMLPLLAWILWRRPAWRLPFGGLVLVAGLGALATGEAGAWITSLTSVPDAVAASSRDVGPALLLGRWWLPLGAVLAIWLTIRGRIGLASMAASFYWLPQYLLMTLLELIPARPAAPAATTRSVPRD